METGLISFIIMVTVFVTYIGFILIKYGVLPSVSESYYRLPRKYQFLFTLFCWGFAIPAIICGDSLLMFLAGSGIAFVGAAAAFKEKMENWVHMTGAYFGIAMSQLSIYFDFGLLYVNIISVSLAILITLLSLKWIKNKIWWIEIVAFLSICYALGERVL